MWPKGFQRWPVFGLAHYGAPHAMAWTARDGLLGLLSRLAALSGASAIRWPGRALARSKPAAGSSLHTLPHILSLLVSLLTRAAAGERKAMAIATRRTPEDVATPPGCARRRCVRPWPARSSVEHRS